MTNTNQIIIPISSHCSLPQHGHMDTPPAALHTPSKVSSPQLALPWRKTHSAFKKFRERKDRKAAVALAGAPEPQELPQEPARKYKLTPLAGPKVEIQLFFSSLGQLQPEFDYYDPNLAPLYRLPDSEEPLTDLFEAPLCTKKHQKPISKKQESPQEAPCIKIQSLPVRKSEEGHKESLSLTCEDDPFIIVRSDSHSKTTKSFKNKLIKKEKVHKNIPDKPHKRIDSLVPVDKSISGHMMVPEGGEHCSRTPPAFRAPLSMGISRPSPSQAIQIQSSPADTPGSDEEEGSKWNQQACIQCD